MVPRREENSSELSGNQKLGPREENLVGPLTPFEPSLWNDPTFDVVTFVNRFFSFFRNIQGDYNMLSVMSPTQLSTLLEV